jgi:hypothetical protein
MSYDQSATYLRSNSMIVDSQTKKQTPARLMHAEKSPDEKEPSGHTLDSVAKLFHTMASESDINHTYHMFNAKTFRESLGIPSAIWAELEPLIKDRINEIRAELKAKRGYSNQTPVKHDQPKPYSPKDDKKMPNQYPTMKPKQTVANLVNSLADLNMDSDDDTDNEAIDIHPYMVRTRLPLEPPSDILDVRAHFEYIDHALFNDSIYAISDGGADSCILGKNAKVLSYTGRHANLVGYDPSTTRTDKVPIVTALIKAKSNVNSMPILLKVNEAPYNPLSPITLLSEYQIREYGMIIDSVAKKHQSSPDKHGTQRFNVNAFVHINFEDRGGTHGF